MPTSVTTRLSYGAASRPWRLATALARVARLLKRLQNNTRWRPQ